MVLADILRIKMEESRFGDNPRYTKYKKRQTLILDTAMFIWQEVRKEFLQMNTLFEEIGFENICVIYEFSDGVLFYKVGNDKIRKRIKIKIEQDLADYYMTNVLKMVGYYASLEGFKTELCSDISPRLLVTI